MQSMTGPITWEAVFALAAILGAIVGVWLRIENRIEKMIVPINERIDEELELVKTQVNALQASIRLVESQLNEHKLYAAEHYARDTAVQSMREEILTRLDQINGRLDRVILPSAARRGGAG